MKIALLAALCMVVTDVLGTVMVIAEARERGWLAGACDSVGWLFSIATTAISVTALQGHSIEQKVLVVALVSAANLFGTKLGQVIGSRFVVAKGTTEARLAALERALADKSR